MSLTPLANLEYPKFVEGISKVIERWGIAREPSLATSSVNNLGGPRNVLCSSYRKHRIHKAAYQAGFKKCALSTVSVRLKAIGSLNNRELRLQN